MAACSDPGAKGKKPDGEVMHAGGAVRQERLIGTDRRYFASSLRRYRRGKHYRHSRLVPWGEARTVSRPEPLAEASTVRAKTSAASVMTPQQDESLAPRLSAPGPKSPAADGVRSFNGPAKLAEDVLGAVAGSGGGNLLFEAAASAAERFTPWKEKGGTCIV